MKNITLWIAIGVGVLFVLVLAAVVFLPLMTTNSVYGYGCAYGGNGYGMMGNGGFTSMMGGWGTPFGFLGMLLMWLIPLTFLALIIGGIYWLARAIISRPPQI